MFTGVGLVSGAGIAAASGVLAGFGASAAAGLGSALTAVGLGGVASWMGIAPATTFLGLTAAGWAMMGISAIALALGAIFTRRVMKKINEERGKGGLKKITVRQLLAEVRDYEADAMREVLKALSAHRDDINFSGDENNVFISGRMLSVDKLRYRVNKDGSEVIGYITRLGRFASVYLVKPAGALD